MVAAEGPVVHVLVRVLVLVGRSTQLLVHQRPRGRAPLLLAPPPPLPDDLVRHEGGGHCSVDMSDSSDREEHVGGDDHDRRRSRRWPRRELVRRGRQRLGNGFSHRRELGLATRVQAQDPAACYLVTARTEVSKTAPYRLHTAYLILEKSKSECKIHFSILPVQRKYGRTEIDTEAKTTKSNSGNRRSDDGKNRP